MGVNVGTLVGALAGVNVVGFLIEDVVDAVDQKVEWKGHPNQDRNDGGCEEVAREPHAHNGRTNRVHPEHRSGDLD